MKKIKEFINKSTTQTKILIIIAISILLLSSYTIRTGQSLGKISIQTPYQNSRIFLDNKEVRITKYNNQTITLSKIPQGEHSVLVYTDEYYPWGKTVYIENGDLVKIYPFLIRMKLSSDSSKTTTQFTEENLSKINLLLNDQNKDNFISFSGDGNVKIEKQDNAIFATWIGNRTSAPEYFCNKEECKKMINVFTPETGKIKIIGFYPEREDVVIFSLENSIYAIEIDKNGTQNFQPIYTGEDPSFAIDQQDSTIYVKDGELIFSVAL